MLAKTFPHGEGGEAKLFTFDNDITSGSFNLQGTFYMGITVCTTFMLLLKLYTLTFGGQSVCFDASRREKHDGVIADYLSLSVQKLSVKTTFAKNLALTLVTLTLT